MIIKIHRIINLLVPTFGAGFIIYFLFNYAGWWNPLLSGIFYGLFQFGCLLPLTIKRLKQNKREVTGE